MQLDVAELLGEEPNSRFMSDALAVRQRKHFFIRVGSSLSQRGQTIFKSLTSNNIMTQEEIPGKPQCQALCNERAMSLISALKMNVALDEIARHTDDVVKAVTFVKNKCFIIEPGGIVASIYYARPAELENFREMKGLGIVKMSEAAFGPGHMHGWRYLEKGDGEGNHYRITRATLDSMAHNVGDRIREYFTTDPAAGPRKGENTVALAPSNGNLLSWAPPATKVADPVHGKPGE